MDYVTFTIDNDQFALPVSQVREILQRDTITHLPDLDDCMLGIINLRGSVVPVMDLGKRLGLTTREQTGHGDRNITQEQTIIILEASEGAMVGLITDVVREVVQIPQEDIQPPPKTGLAVRESELLRGIVSTNDSFTILLAPEPLLGGALV